MDKETAKKKKARDVLFVCYANINRSPTAERVFKEMLKERGYKIYDKENSHNYDIKVLSAGIDAWTGNNQMTQDLGDKVDEIFALDGSVKHALIKGFNQSEEKVVNLNIPDVYHRDDPSLVRVLREKLVKYCEPRDN